MRYQSMHMKDYIQNTINTLKDKIYSPIGQLTADVWVTKEPVTFDQKESGTQLALKVGDKWGEQWDCGWFHFTGSVPSQGQNKKIVLLIDLNGEGCVFDEKGCPVRGLTNVNSEFDLALGMPGKRVLQFSECAKGNEKVDIWIDGGNNDLFGHFRSGTLQQADIAICNEPLRQLYYDFYVLYDIAQALPENSARQAAIMYTLNDAANCFVYETEEEIEKASVILKKELDKKAGSPSLYLSAIGHAHIDLAWLWPIRETIRKGARTYATVMDLMDRYGDYKFGASQPQMYKWMKNHYPALYEKIKEKIKEKRWEVQGAMWVEPDTNVPSGESLVRQILYGKRFYQKEFGINVKSLWLPDVFGYTAALPQILKKSGIDYFMTIKLSWSEHNKFPYHTFYWQGIDGSQVLSHMPPNGTYNDPVRPKYIKMAEENYLEKGLSDNALVLFGIGDGGGGPGPEHLERLKRVKSVEGLSPVSQEFSSDFFEKLDNPEKSHRYPKWNGELYLEKHQGTYTTHAKNKRFNRKMEWALHDTEFVSYLATEEAKESYPIDKLNEIWEEVLLYQFHDILPGSSISRVYDESVARYEVLHSDVNDMFMTQVNTIIEKQWKKTDGVFAFNTLSWARDEYEKIDGQWYAVSVPSLGYAELSQNNLMNEAESNVFGYTEDTFENDCICIRLNKDGSICSVFDKECSKEVIEKGKSANIMEVYHDTGNAWDIMINYDEKPHLAFQMTKRESKIDGPKLIVTQQYTFGKSTLTQQMVLTKGTKRIDFVTDVDWNEDHKMLRTSFPVNVFAEQVTCDIQFGKIKRSITNNTSWDYAQFEICANKYVDLSREDYGVALLNDCKYGHKVKGNVLNLNLLRSTKAPDECADIGQHTFTYALFPHIGNEVKGSVLPEAYALNAPLRIVEKGSVQETPVVSYSFASVDNPNIVIETIKKAEDSNSTVVRMYESAGYSSEGTISFNKPAKKMALISLTEENETPVPYNGNEIALSFEPFEIKTLLVTF